MSLNNFADAQKSHNTIYPTFTGKYSSNDECIPFVKLFDGEESPINLEKRWQLYHQLHSHFHQSVDAIISNIETDLKKEISDILFSGKNDLAGKNRNKKRLCFKTLFLLGSDGSTNIEFPPGLNTNSVFNTVIELTPKESPNVRMMLRRSMYKLFSQLGSIDSESNLAMESSIDANHVKLEDKNGEETMISESIKGENIINHHNESYIATSYDLTLVKNFKLLYKRNLNLIINFKDVDSFNFVNLNDFILLLESTLKNDHVNISLVFNVNTNLTNLDKNLTNSTLRILKRHYYVLDVSSNKGFKYGNRIFQSFLDTVDGKLNLSKKFLKFILEKMANNTNHNLQLLTKILDYSLMSYFYQNPFSVFIDPVNVDFLDEKYLDLLCKCPTFMFFVDDMVKKRVPEEEILSLLTNEDKALEEFFIQFLVQDNPINRHAKYVAEFLENTLKITNYNLIELYYCLLKGSLNEYLDKWPQCQPHKEELAFAPIDTTFQELFTLDNDTGLLTQSMFPGYKANIEENLLNWEKILPLSSVMEDDNIKDIESLRILNDSVGPMVSELYKHYREAGSLINLFDFYSTFKETLPEEIIMKFLFDRCEEEPELKKFLQSSDQAFEKVTLVLFILALSDLQYIGIVKLPAFKKHEAVEKAAWKGV